MASGGRIFLPTDSYVNIELINMDAYVIITLNQRNADNMGVWGEFDFFDREMNCYSYHRCSWPAFHFMILPNE